MTTVALTASPRSDFGKGAARRTRREGNTPAVIYGGDVDLLHISINTHELNLALRKPRVVLSLSVDGREVLTKPRDIQRDPVKRTLEHIDLVVITAEEAQQRSDMADAIQAATDAAEEAGMDAAAAVQALEVAVAAGEDPTAAAAHAVEDAEHKAEEYAEANKAESNKAEAAAESTSTPE